jgi:hypothetical protein
MLNLFDDLMQTTCPMLLQEKVEAAFSRLSPEEMKIAAEMMEGMKHDPHVAGFMIIISK